MRKRLTISIIFVFVAVAVFAWVETKTHTFRDTTNSITLDGSTDCLIDSVNFFSDPLSIVNYSKLTLYLKCTENVTTPIATEYQTSPSKELADTVWFDGMVSIDSLDVNSQVIVIDENNSGESAIRWIRLHVDNSTGVDSASVLAQVVLQTE